MLGNRHILALVMALAASLPLMAAAKVIISDPSQLGGDPAIKKLYRPFVRLAQGTVIYDRCATVFKFKPEVTEKEHQEFIEVAKDYSKAYYDAYARYIGITPTQEMVDTYGAYIQQQQQTAVNEISQLITAASCNTERVYNVVQYIENRRLQKAHDEAVAATTKKKSVPPEHDPNKTPLTPTYNPGEQ